MPVEQGMLEKRCVQTFTLNSFFIRSYFYGCKLCELRQKHLDYVLDKLNEEFSNVNNVWRDVTNATTTTKSSLNTYYVSRSNVLQEIHHDDNNSAIEGIRKYGNDSDSGGHETKCNSILYDSSWIEMLPDNILRPPEGVLL